MSPLLSVEECVCLCPCSVLQEGRFLTSVWPTETKPSKKKTWRDWWDRSWRDFPSFTGTTWCIWTSKYVSLASLCSAANHHAFKFTFSQIRLSWCWGGVWRTGCFCGLNTCYSPELYTVMIMGCSVVFLAQPQNILLTSESPLGDIKVVDFGLSRLVSSGQEIREIMGTPEYVGKIRSQIRFRALWNQVYIFLNSIFSIGIFLDYVFYFFFSVLIFHFFFFFFLSGFIFFFFFFYLFFPLFSGFSFFVVLSFLNSNFFFCLHFSGLFLMVKLNLINQKACLIN